MREPRTALVRFRWLSLALCGAIALLAAPARADARDFIVQDDAAIMNPATRSIALDRMVELGATHVRVFVQHERTNPDVRYDVFIGYGRRPAPVDYIPAFRDIAARGLRVYANLSWYGQDDPARLAEWAGVMIAALAEYVDTWAIMNEPDLTMFEDPCTPTEVRAAIIRKHITTRRVKRYLHLRRAYRTMRGRLVRPGVRYRRSVRMGRSDPRGRRKKFVHYTRSEGGLYVRRTRYRVVTGTRLEPISAEHACLLISRGQKYSKIVAAMVPVVRRHDPTARVVGGELSPVAGVSTLIKAVDWTPVDAISVHPYPGHDKDFAIYNIEAIKRMLPKPVLVSEFGIRPGPDQVSELVRTWQLTAAAGLAPAQYTLYGSHGGWDTSILDDHTMRTSPAFEAIRRMRQEHP
jgi:hypothetical protein